MEVIRAKRNGFFLGMWHPPTPRNANNVEHLYIRNAALCVEIWHPYPTALRNTWVATYSVLFRFIKRLYIESLALINE